jgi:hypothetical protein
MVRGRRSEDFKVFKYPVGYSHDHASHVNGIPVAELNVRFKTVTQIVHFFTKAAIKVLIICYCSFVGQNVLRAHKTDAPPIRIAIPSARNRADRFRGCVLITVGTIALVLALYVLPWLAQQDFGR